MRWRPPGIAAILAMGVVALLAHGVPGIASQPPSGEWVDDQLAAQLKADTKITIITDGQELPPGALPVEPVVTEPGHRAQPYVRDFRALALHYAKEAGIKNPKLFVRQMAAESGFQPCARSGAGAIGIAQIMPGTAKSWHVDPYIPEDSLKVAARHMAAYERAFGSYALAAAAYNAGPGAVNAAGGRVPAYPETREYVRRITNRHVELRGLSQVYRLPGGLQASFARRLYALQLDVRRHGGRLHVNEGFRSYEDQLRLWKAAKRRYGSFAGAKVWVAPPGCSNHNRGYAADLGGNLRLAHKLAAKHHLVFPMAHEPWHVEPAGLSTQSG